MSVAGESFRKVIVPFCLLLFEVGVGYGFFGTNLFEATSSKVVQTRASIGTVKTKKPVGAKVQEAVKEKGLNAYGSSTTTSSTLNSPTTTLMVTTTTVPSYQSTTTAASVYATITVRVANGTSISGLAERITTYLGGVGFDVVSPVNATASVQSSTIYYAPGFSVSAEYIASRLGLSSAQVVPDSTAMPVNAPPEDINVVAGPDLSSAP